MEQSNSDSPSSLDKVEPLPLLRGKPIWHSPAWVTAIIGLISVFFTVPEVIGNYLEKQQDIRIAQEKTEGLRLSNTDSKQSQEFKIVNSTLAQQGTERVFILRYLAATLDDADAKLWASDEVKRLEDLATSQKELDNATSNYEEKSKELEAIYQSGKAGEERLKSELEKLQEKLKNKNNEVNLLKQKAGIKSKDSQHKFFKILIRRIASPPITNQELEALYYELGAFGKFSDGKLYALSCIFNENGCSILLTYLPEILYIELSDPNGDIGSQISTVSAYMYYPITETPFLNAGEWKYVCKKSLGPKMPSLGPKWIECKRGEKNQMMSSPGDLIRPRIAN